MAPADVVIHSFGIRFGAMGTGGAMDPTIPLAPVRAFSEPPGVDEAAELLAAAPVDAIGFAFTSSAYVIGAAGEAVMVARLKERTGGVPVAATCAAAVVALRALGVRRLVVVNPPWFDEELDALGAAYFRERGFDVVHSSPAGLPSDQRAIEPEALYDWVRSNVPAHAEGLFIGGNGFRSVGVIEALEAELGQPVVTANQALFWNLLDVAGGAERVVGYGRLFEHRAPTRRG